MASDGNVKNVYSSFYGASRFISVQSGQGRRGQPTSDDNEPLGNRKVEKNALT